MQGEGEEWRIVTGGFSSPMHIALDRVITRRVAEGESPPTLRFWDWQNPTVVIGRFQSLKEEVFEDMAEKHDVEVVRRTTGGGAMFCEPRDVITYSLSLPESWLESDDIVESYRELENWSLEAMDSIGAEAEHQPINDIVKGEKKIGGSAQARRGGTVLHHTMLAYDLDVEKMLKVLRIGEEKISDKAVKSAEKRVSPLSDQVDLPRGEVIERMVESFAQGRSVRSGSLQEEEVEEAEELVEQRYGTDEWKYRVDREIEGLEQ
ncbi:MAG: biotin/lipoate A/B protein ligase family protein [Candidatus Nanohaloarchaea archaeon]|nr:biotin/lipoate A/B protein ligase family protein [Candidatus Nanohaloarchaea archaeon]